MIFNKHFLTYPIIVQIKMELKPVVHPMDTIKCHKWIAVGDIYLDFTLMDYDRYNFNDFYIVHNSRENDGVFCGYRPRRNSVGEWAKADLIRFIKNYKKLLTFIDLRAPFINLKTDERVCVKGKLKQKVFVFFPSDNEIETAVTCLYLKQYNYRYSVFDHAPF